LEPLLDRVIEYTGADSGVLISVDAEGSLASIVEAAPDPVVRYALEAAAGRAAAFEETIEPDVEGGRGRGSALAVPARVRGRVTGVLALHAPRVADAEAAIVAILPVVGLMLGSASADRRDVWLTRLFEWSVDMLCTVDFDGYLDRVNPAFERTLGHPASELRSRPLWAFLHPDDQAGMRAVFRGLQRAAAPARFDCRWLTRDGEARWLSWHAVPDAGDGCAYAVARDVTEGKEVERLKGEFVSMVSHELRTPLTSIKGALGLLGAGAAGPLPDRATELVRVAGTNAERLLRLINDILDLERLEAGRMSLDLTSLRPADLVGECLEGLAHIAARASVEVTSEVARELVLRADRDRLMQVMTNLVDNAIKFSPAGGRVTVTVDGTDPVRFRVTDEGAGIAPEHHDRVFARFSQVDASDRRVKGGTGLGLAICKRIVEDHRGLIRVHSEPGRGATFEFQIPRGLVAPGRRVLVCVGDDALARMVVARLDTHGYGADRVTTMADAERAAAEHPPAVVLIDGALGGGAAKVLAADLHAGGQPVLLLAAAEIGLGLPWLRKPFEAEALIASLDDLLVRDAR